MQTFLFTEAVYFAGLITIVYIPPHANAKLALEELHNSVNSQLNTEVVVILARDFSYTDLKTVHGTQIHEFHHKGAVFFIRYTQTTGEPKATAAPHYSLLDPILFL